MSSFTEERMKYKPKLVSVFEDMRDIRWQNNDDGILMLTKGRHVERARQRVGVLFSGGPAPGGWNVVWGLFDAIKAMHPKSELIGFLGGPKGLLENKFMKITESDIALKKNCGGFDILGSGRDKIDGVDQFEKAFKVIKEQKLDGILIIGGDDSNTNAKLLSDYLEKEGSSCIVTGAPKTIDGDLKSHNLESSFGFDTACKIYSEMIGNICIDARSSLKYYHIVKLMGRSASHVTAECALQTCPNIVFIGEEIAKRNMTLAQVISYFVDTVEKRAQNGKHYGVALVPEGLLEFIPEVKQLIADLSKILANNGEIDDLTEKSRACLDSFPKEIKEQLLLGRDSHGNVRLSQIETEKLIGIMVQNELSRRGTVKNFSAVYHFLGYEGRCGFPSNFDSDYCYNLGYVAASLISDRKVGYISAIKNLASSVAEWEAIGLPFESMMGQEERNGKLKKVILKTLVDLEGSVFKKLMENREKFRFDDHYKVPGPMQFYGPSSANITKTLHLESLIKQ